MKEETLKKTLIITVIVSILVLMFIIYIGINTFDSKKASLSVYPDIEPGTTFEGMGIKEEEFRSYLSVFSLLVNDNYSEENKEVLDNTRFLDTAAGFLKNLSSYEQILNEQSSEVYSSENINVLAKEINGMYVNNAINAGTSYVYNETDKTYIKNETKNRSAECTEIESVEKNGDTINVKYKCVFIEDEQKLEKTYNIQATILENEKYQYSKYFVHAINIY